MTRPHRWWLVSSVFLFFVCAVGIVRADTDLAIACPDVSYVGQIVAGTTTKPYCAGQQHVKPVAATVVRTHPTGVNVQWGDVNHKWVTYGSLPANGLYEVCKTNVAIGSNESGGCTQWGYLQKSGVVIPPAVGTGQAILTWTASTQNTDGSALTDLAGYKVWQGASATSLLVIATVNALTYTVNGLPVGTHYFAVSAYTTSGVDSATSNPGSKQILAVVKIPKSPGALTIQ